jgi:hypothetical protein
VQVILALVVTPEGFPLAYEVMKGNTSDKTTLQAFLNQIEKQYGKAQRIWVMDRGIPTEETLAAMRQSEPPVLYLVGTPKGRLSKLEHKLLEVSWQKLRAGVEVKLLGRRLKDLAPGLTTRSVLEKMAAMQMIDVHLPTTDNRKIILTRYTQPEPEQRILLEKLKLTLPEQPPPKITSAEFPTNQAA